MSQLTTTPEGEIYEVFARFREPQMHHLGSVVALTDELAKMYAARLYDEWGWQEMIVVRRQHITHIITPQ